MNPPRYGTPEFRAAVVADIRRRLALARRPRKAKRPPQLVRISVEGWPFLVRVEDRPGWRQRYMRCVESARRMVPPSG